MPRLTEPEQPEFIRFLEADIFGNNTMTIVEVNVPKNSKNERMK